MNRPVPYSDLVRDTGQLQQKASEKSTRTVNNLLVNTCWHIGLYIVEYDQREKEKAAYGIELLDKLSEDLTLAYGKSFSRSNLFQIRNLYQKIPKTQTLSEQLTWNRYVEILKVDNDRETWFYTRQCEKENRSVPELKRQMKSMLFHRLVLSTDKQGVLKIVEKGLEIQRSEDILKDPYIFEFLEIPQSQQYLEGKSDEKFIQNLEKFLLELGKGFAFIRHQYRVPVGNQRLSPDLVFYHRILKCFVSIEKRREIEYDGVTQMNLYLNYFSKEENVEGDNPPIGIVLGTYKDQPDIGRICYRKYQ